MMAGVALAMGVGCARTHRTLDVTSYRDPYFPETLSIEFTERGFARTADGDTHIVARESSPGGAGVVEQLLHMHVFWKPRPGRTFADSSSVDATIRYVIATDQGRSVYAGTGFVYKKFSRDEQRLEANVEASELRLVRTAGDPPTSMGPIALRGKLTLERARALVTDVRREVDYYATERSE